MSEILTRLDALEAAALDMLQRLQRLEAEAEQRRFAMASLMMTEEQRQKEARRQRWRRIAAEYPDPAA